jgi:predicted ribosomally synthesized peptide with SipW-like signal peptide
MQMLNKNLKKKLFIVALLTVMIVSIGGTIAYLTDRSPVVTNTFNPVHIDSEVQDDYRIRVAGQIPGKVRAFVTYNWVDSEGRYVYFADMPEPTINTADWTLGTDGYYYYNEVVQPENYTTALLTAPSVTKEGYRLKIEVISEAIQDAPAAALTAAGWEH